MSYAAAEPEELLKHEKETKHKNAWHAPLSLLQQNTFFAAAKVEELLKRGEEMGNMNVMHVALSLLQ